MCKRSFIRQKRKPVSFKDFVHFYWFVKGEANKAGLIKLRHQGRKTISSCFKVFFNNPLAPIQAWQVLPPRLNKPWIYGVDGKWLKRQGVFIIHRNITTKENIYWSFHKSESYEALSRDLEALAQLLNDRLPVGAISDWKGAIVSGVTSHMGKIHHQRCLTHVVRQAKNLLPQKSSFAATVRLRHIAKLLPHIKTVKEKRAWLASLIAWEKLNNQMLREKTIGIDTKASWVYPWEFKKRLETINP